MTDLATCYKQFVRSARDLASKQRSTAKNPQERAAWDAAAEYMTANPTPAGSDHEPPPHETTACCHWFAAAARGLEKHPQPVPEAEEEPAWNAAKNYVKAYLKPAGDHEPPDLERTPEEDERMRKKAESERE